VGEVEVMPRKVLMVHNTANTEYDLIDTSALHYGTMPLNYLGYSAEYVDARRSLPSQVLSGRYAGIVVWLDRPAGRESAALSAWVKNQAEAGVPVVVLGEGGFLVAGAEAKQLGLQVGQADAGRSRLSIVQQDAIAGFETPPSFDRSTFFPLHVQGGKPLLTVADQRGEKQEAVALTPWGGYALNPYALFELPSEEDEARLRDSGKNLRWVINPVEFLRRALRLPDMPVPDVTTESGRRLLMVHMDGDGFASKSEFPGAPYAAEVMHQRILEKYRIPATVSVIQGEIAPDGLYPARSAALEQIARSMFALPHVEIASHTYSHPFSWRLATGKSGEEGYHLKLPNYSFDLKKEISGSIAYIESRLAPPGKKVRSFLWTGDCNIGNAAIEMVERAGVTGMNGGETLITRSNPTLTLVAPLGVPKGDRFQVYAPNQNENVYTNDWHGPFYGYERAIETFELTDAPYRLKPIDIYFHTYSASKPASLKALDKVFQWAQARETMPLHVADYVRKVNDFNHLVVARTVDGWLVRGKGDLRELRAPATLGFPQIRASEGLAGYSSRGTERYLHLAQGEARIRFRQAASTEPYLVSANAVVAGWKRSSDGRETILSLRGEVPLKFVLSMGNNCSLRAGGNTLQSDRVMKDARHFSLRDHVSDELRIHCPQ
jgi:peptidoglycan/xylan/chitin deacetylase (PgdA/CDA1 family)